MSARRKITVKIGTLALDGVSRAEAAPLVDALKSELGRLFSERGAAAVDALAAGPVRRARLDAGVFPSALAGAGAAGRYAAAVSDGARIAAGIYRGLAGNPGRTTNGNLGRTLGTGGSPGTGRGTGNR